MKKSILKALTFSFFIAMTSCGDKAKEAETKKAETEKTMKAAAVKYTADVNSSTIEWKGFKPTGSHSGTLAISNGTIAMNNNTIESGSFTIDMTKLEVTDIPKEEEGNAKLAGHLKNADFFDVKKHPISKLKIISTTRKSDNNIGVIAELTIKGVTNKINFDSKLEFLNGKSIMTSKFIIDRTLWGIDYESKGLFGSLKDNVISDAIEFEVIVEWPGGGC